MVIPQENEKDLAEIPKNIKDKLEILPVKWIDEVLELALRTCSHAKPSASRLSEQREAQPEDGTWRAKRSVPHIFSRLCKNSTAIDTGWAPGHRKFCVTSW